MTSFGAVIQGLILVFSFFTITYIYEITSPEVEETPAPKKEKVASNQLDNYTNDLINRLRPYAPTPLYMSFV